MTLRQYIKSQDASHRFFARKTGQSDGYVSKQLSGKLPVTKPLRAALENRFGVEPISNFFDEGGNLIVYDEKRPA